MARWGYTFTVTVKSTIDMFEIMNMAKEAVLSEMWEQQEPEGTFKLHLLEINRETDNNIQYSFLAMKG